MRALDIKTNENMNNVQLSSGKMQDFHSGYIVPYTREELFARIAKAEREAAAGLGQESEEMFRELDEIFSREEMEVYA